VEIKVGDVISLKDYDTDSELGTVVKVGSIFIHVVDENGDSLVLAKSDIINI